MARVIFQVGEEEKALWVEAAHRELVSLSEWLRRAAQVRAGGLAGGDHNAGAVESRPSLSQVAPPARPPHKADPKDKAAMEHGSRERSPRSGMCEHRVPLGSFCKRCEDDGLAAGGGAGPEAGEVMPKDDRHDTDARRASLGARSLDVPPAASPSFKPDPKVKK